MINNTSDQDPTLDTITRITPTMCGRPGRDQPGHAGVLCGSHAAFAGRRSSVRGFPQRVLLTAIVMR
jgi:hypothetical protein